MTAHGVRREFSFITVIFVGHSDIHKEIPQASSYENGVRDFIGTSRPISSLVSKSNKIK